MSGPKRASRAARRTDAITDREMDEVMRLILGQARQGSLHALRLLERHWRLSDRPVKLDLPLPTDARSIAEGQARVIAASTDGETLTSRQGLALSAMLEHRRRALETVEFDRVLTDIEADQKRAETLREEIRAEIRKL
jgi:hypothetical protein